MKKKCCKSYHTKYNKGQFCPHVGITKKRRKTFKRREESRANKILTKSEINHDQRLYMYI